VCYETRQIIKNFPKKLQNNEVQKYSWRPKWWEGAQLEHYIVCKEEETQGKEEAK